MLTQKDISNYNELNDRIYKRAEEVLSIYKKVRNEVFGDKFPKGDGIFPTESYSADYVGFKEIDGESIIFTGDEFWSYGGHQAHMLSLPLNYLTSTDEVIEDTLKIKFFEIRDEERRKKELKAKLDEVKEKEMFKKLQEKYGNR